MTKSIIRIAILVSLFTCAVICLLSEPSDGAEWLSALIVSKGICAACIWTLSRLYPRWSKTDRWIARYDAWCMKGIGNKTRLHGKILR